DSGPLIALIDRHDKDHQACSKALSRLALPLLTTYPVLTESMYFLGSRIGWRAQQVLWKQIAARFVDVADLPQESLLKMEELMAKYADTPMDFSDASLVAMAEQRKVNQ